MKLTITKIHNKPHFLLGMRKMYPQTPLEKLISWANNLPYVDSDMWWKEKDIQEVLATHCEYSYSRTPEDYGCTRCIPIWETQAYIDAENWYKTLPEEDRKKIDLLKQGMIPYG